MAERKPRKAEDPRTEGFYVALGKRLQRVRAAHGMTQRDAADLLGCTPASISSIESGKQRPPIFEIFRMAEAFGLGDEWRVLIPGGDPDRAEDLEAAISRLIPEIKIIANPEAEIVRLIAENQALASGVLVARSDTRAAELEFTPKSIEIELPKLAQDLADAPAREPVVIVGPDQEEMAAKILGIDERVAIDSSLCSKCMRKLDTGLDREFGKCAGCRRAETDSIRISNGTLPPSGLDVERSDGRQFCAICASPIAVDEKIVKFYSAGVEQNVGPCHAELFA